MPSSAPAPPPPPDLAAPPPRALPAWTAGRKRAFGRSAETSGAWLVAAMAAALALPSAASGSLALTLPLAVIAIFMGAAAWRYRRQTREEWRAICDLLANGVPAVGRVVKAWDHVSPAGMLVGVKRTGDMRIVFTYEDAGAMRTVLVKWDSYGAERSFGFVPEAGDVVFLAIRPGAVRRGRFPGDPAAAIWSFARAPRP